MDTKWVLAEIMSGIPTKKFLMIGYRSVLFIVVKMFILSIARKQTKEVLNEENIDIARARNGICLGSRG